MYRKFWTLEKDIFVTGDGETNERHGRICTKKTKILCWRSCAQSRRHEMYGIYVYYLTLFLLYILWIWFEKLSIVRHRMKCGTRRSQSSIGSRV